MSSSMIYTGGGSPSVPPPDSSKNPSDFYNYINGKWQRHVHIPSFSGSYGVSEELETDVRNTLLSLVLDLRKKEPTNPLAVLANSFFNTSFQANSIIDLQRLTNMFECISNVHDICHSIGALNKIQSRAPISCVVSSDSNDNTKCVIYLYEAQLGLPDRQFYQQPHNKILSHYIRLLKQAGELLNIEGLESVVTIEAAIEPFLASNGELRDITYAYNPVAFAELQTVYPQIDWTALFTGWGVTKAVFTRATFIVTNPRYMTLLNKMCRVFDLEAWRTWLRANVILHFMEYLPPPFDDIWFGLYGHALKGNAEKLPQKWLTLKVLESFTPQDLSRLYVTNVVPRDTKERATDLIKKLKNATVKRLQDQVWMSDKTRESSIEKVKQMLFQVAYPARWQSECARVPIHPMRPLLNIINLSVADSQKMIGDLGHKCGRNNAEWEDGAFVVNAYYYAEENRMTIPAGMLMPPFFDLKRSNAWNYGGIGVAIGHEITHGFDDEGRLYDADGNYNNMWTAEDERSYASMTRSVIALFDRVEYMGGHVDGKLTLSENIADLGGLAIALTALNSELKGESEAAKKKAWRDFFTSYAVSWRNKDRPRKAKQSLLLDVHAPAPLRVNLIVRNFEEWYTAFDIKEGDKGWVPLAERVALW